MFFLINDLSFLRVPLAFCFLYDSVLVRLCAVVGAMITDVLDGYLARKFKLTSTFGALIDPLTDKFFVFFASIVFLVSGKLFLWQVGLLLFRDFCLCCLGLYLWKRGLARWGRIRSVPSSKMTTFVQFLILMALCFNVQVPGYVFFVFIVLGLLALRESYIHFVGANTNTEDENIERKVG